MEAVTERQDIKVILTGKQEVIDKELAKYSGYPKNQIQVVNASQVIETAEPPVFAIRKKKDSSIVVGLNMVKKQEQMPLFHQEVQELFLLADRYW